MHCSLLTCCLRGTGEEKNDSRLVLATSITFLEMKERLLPIFQNMTQVTCKKQTVASTSALGKLQYYKVMIKYHLFFVKKGYS